MLGGRHSSLQADRQDFKMALIRLGDRGPRVWGTAWQTCRGEKALGSQPFPTGKANPSPQACPWSELMLHRHGAPTWPTGDAREPCLGPRPCHLMKPLGSLTGTRSKPTGRRQWAPGQMSVFHSDPWVLRGGLASGQHAGRGLELVSQSRAWGQGRAMGGASTGPQAPGCQQGMGA